MHAGDTTVRADRARQPGEPDVTVDARSRGDR